LFVLEPKLGRVGKVLILTAATLPKVTALRFHALRRGLDDPYKSRPGKTLFDFGNFRFDDLADRHERDEHNEVRHPRHAFTAEGNIVNRQSQSVANGRSHRSRLANWQLQKRGFWAVEQQRAERHG